MWDLIARGRRRALGSTAAVVATSVGLLLVGSQAHANGLAVLDVSLRLGFIGAVLLMPVVVAVEALAYRAVVGATWGRAWLSAVVAGVAGVPPMAVALFCLSVAYASGYDPEKPPFVLVGVVCILAAVGLRTVIAGAMTRQAPAAGPAWRVVLPTVALTTALVIGICFGPYHLPGF